MSNQTALSPAMRRFLYIVSGDEAQEEIDKFRILWGIDPGGFIHPKDYDYWAENAINNPPVPLKRISTKHTDITYFIAKKSVQRVKIESGSIITSLKTSKQKLFNDNFRRAILELGRKIHMDNTWEKLFSRYVLRGKRVFARDPGPALEIHKITESDRVGNPLSEKLNVIIEPNTTKEEVLSAWERIIKAEKKSMIGYIDVPPNWQPRAPELPHFVKRKSQK